MTHEKELVNWLSPTNAAIITSYKCNAQCKECCFGCSPFQKINTNLKDYTTFIDSVIKYKSVKFIVWTGGEATLLKEELLLAIKYAKSKGLFSRLVTNGVWASNYDRANKFLKNLRDNGVMEISFSTGDNHLEFVPLDRVMTGALACIENGIRCTISVESTKHSKFKQEHLFLHELYQKIENHPNKELFSSISSTWVSFHKDTIYEYNEL
ncbi:radical SAM protein, partial [Enterococcus hirae]|nr:radical SAM protein [Enterococcus hirae]